MSPTPQPEPRVPPWIAAAQVRRESERVSTIDRLTAQLPLLLEQLVHAGRLQAPVLLFGSLARRTFEPSRSDIDLMVQSADDPFDVAGELELQLGFPVHIVQRNLAPESLVEHVLAEGVVLHDG